MSRRHRIHAKRRRRLPLPATPLSRETAASPDDIAIPRIEEPPPIDIDRLVPAAVHGDGNGAGLRDPPALIVEGPEGAARRRARDARDGVEVADPRRGPLYVGIAVFVALLVFVVLSLIEMREGTVSLAP